MIMLLYLINLLFFILRLSNEKYNVVVAICFFAFVFL